MPMTESPSGPQDQRSISGASLSGEAQRPQAENHTASLISQQWQPSLDLFWIWPQSKFQKVLSETCSLRRISRRKPLFLCTKIKTPPPHDLHSQLWWGIATVKRKKKTEPETSRDGPGSLLRKWQGDLRTQHPLRETGLLSSAKLKIRMRTRKIYLSLRGSSDITTVESLQKVCSFLSIHISI